MIYKESILKINEYRNIVVHSFSNELDGIIYSLIYKNVILYAKFLRDFLKEDISSYDKNFILLPIGFNKSFDPIKFLWSKKSSTFSSKQVQDFLKWIIISTDELHKKWIEESLIMTYKLELVWKNKFKNTDILFGISEDSPNKIRKETKMKLSTYPWVQNFREMSDSDIRDNFPILFKDINDILKKRYTCFKMSGSFYIYWKKVKKEEHKGHMWNYDTEKKRYRFNDKIFEVFDKYYTKR